MAPFYSLQAETGSAHLVMSSQAAHWFEPITDFYSEVDRVLTPGGVLLLISHGNPVVTDHNQADNINRLLTKVRTIADRLYNGTSRVPNRISRLCKDFEKLHCPYL